MPYKHTEHGYAVGTIFVTDKTAPATVAHFRAILHDDRITQVFYQPYSNKVLGKHLADFISLYVMIDNNRVWRKVTQIWALEVMFLRDEYEIFAAFPTLKADLQGNITAYARIGQHHAMAVSYIKDCTIVTNENEYRSLLAELKRIGYDNLRIKS